MFPFFFGKTFEPADGSERRSRAAAAIDHTTGPTPSSGEQPGRLSALQQWADDGAPQPVATSLPKPYIRKPGWCVQSLRDLNAAIAQSASADDPERLRQERQADLREQHAAMQAAVDNAAAAEYAVRNRYGNAWEHP